LGDVKVELFNTGLLEELFYVDPGKVLVEEVGHKYILTGD
jgi:hypothetical protein